MVWRFARCFFQLAMRRIFPIIRALIFTGRSSDCLFYFWRRILMTGQVLPTYARMPVTFARGEGAWLWSVDGKRYFDAIAGIAVCNLGLPIPPWLGPCAIRPANWYIPPTCMALSCRNSWPPKSARSAAWTMSFLQFRRRGE
jgi:hypothetical protein